LSLRNDNSNDASTGKNEFHGPFTIFESKFRFTN
jgi:hypothetical protein